MSEPPLAGPPADPGPGGPGAVPPPTAGTTDAAAIDPWSDDGAELLRARVLAAPSRTMTRADLEGHVALTRAELWGVGGGSAGERSAPPPVGERVRVLVGIVLAGIAGGIATIPSIDALRYVLDDRAAARSPVPVGLEALLVVLALAGAAYARSGLRRILREGRAAPDPGARPSDIVDDPAAIATVAVVEAPAALRVALLWLRAVPADGAALEVRFVAETLVPADDPGAAEDAVERYAELALAVGLVRRDPVDDEGRVPGDLRPPVAPRPRTGRTTAAADLVAAARGRVSPGVDPAVPVGDGWDPEALTDDGRAELAARLVLAEPRTWNPDAFESLVVDPDDPLGHRPPRWPNASARSAAVDDGPVVAEDEEQTVNDVVWSALVPWAIIGAVRPDDVTEFQQGQALGWGLLGVALLWHLRDRWVSARGKGRGTPLAHAVREAARGPRSALQQGVPGPDGRVFVLHGVEAPEDRPELHDRLELVHVRPLGGGDPRFEVRTLAWREIARSDDQVWPQEVAQDLWRIADDAGFVIDRAGDDARGVRRLNRALGGTDPRRRGHRAAPFVRVAGVAALIAAVAFVAVAVAAVLGRLAADDVAAATALVVAPSTVALLSRRAAGALAETAG